LTNDRFPFFDQFDQLTRRLINIHLFFQLIPNVYLPEPNPRGFDLAFATTTCDSLLITASASTFSWSFICAITIKDRNDKVVNFDEFFHFFQRKFYGKFGPLNMNILHF
jgi:hypothetical protein